MESALESFTGKVIKDVKETILSDFTPDFLKNIRGEEILKSSSIDDDCKKRLHNFEKQGINTPADRLKIIGFDKGLKIMEQVKASDTAKVLGADFFEGVIAGRLGLPMTRYETQVLHSQGGEKTPQGYLRHQAMEYGRSIGVGMRQSGKEIDFKQCMQLFKISQFSKVKDQIDVKSASKNRDGIKMPTPEGTGNKQPQTAFQPMSAPKREKLPDGSVVVTDILGRKTKYANEWLANNSTDVFSGFQMTQEQIDRNSDARLERSKMPDPETVRLQKKLDESNKYEKERDSYVEQYKDAKRRNDTKAMSELAEKARSAQWKSHQALGRHPEFGIGEKVKGIDW